MTAPELIDIVNRLRCRAFRAVPEEAEDVLQDVLLAGLIALERGRAIENPEAYIGRILRNHIAKAIDARVIRRRDIDIETLLGLGFDWEDDFIASLDARDAVDDGMDRLSESDRELLDRAFLREQSAAEIRREMGIHRAAAYRQRKYRAKRRFAGGDRRAA